MSTSHGVIQGYNAQALLDDTHQVIVATDVFGDGQDALHLTLMMARAKATMQMVEKIDTAEGRKQYSRRLAIVEPVFANIRTQRRLDLLRCSSCDNRRFSN